MNRDEKIEQAIIKSNADFAKLVKIGYVVVDGFILFNDSNLENCSFGEFKHRAKELGFINGYRWGVEYPTNGKRPDLADDVKISAIGSFSQADVGYVCWKMMDSFVITDQRYKPQDTSYLKAPAVEAVEEVAQGDWWDYENAKFLQNPAVGTEILCSCSNDGAGTITDKFSIPVQVIAIHDGKIVVCRSYGKAYFAVSQSEIAPLDHATRKAELEKKRVVDAAMKESDKYVGSHYYLILEKLYDAGYLRLPANKD